MKPRKTDKANLEPKRGLFRDIGFVVAMAVIYIGMSWKSYESGPMALVASGEGAELDSVVQLVAPPPPPPPPPPPVNTQVFEAVDDDLEVPEITFENQEVDDDIEFEFFEEVSETAGELFEFTQVEAFPVYPGCEGEPTNDARWACTVQNIQSDIREEFVFPQIAREMGIGGRAWVNFEIDASGKVKNVTIARTSGDQSIDEEAVRTVKAALPSFTPAKLNGRSVRMTYNVPINARIN